MPAGRARVGGDRHSRARGTRGFLDRGMNPLGGGECLAKRPTEDHQSPGQGAEGGYPGRPLAHQPDPAAVIPLPATLLPMVTNIMHRRLGAFPPSIHSTPSAPQMPEPGDAGCWTLGARHRRTRDSGRVLLAGHPEVVILRSWRLSPQARTAPPSLARHRLPPEARWHFPPQPPPPPLPPPFSPPAPPVGARRGGVSRTVLTGPDIGRCALGAALISGRVCSPARPHRSADSAPARAMAVFMMARYVPAAPLAQSAERLHGKEKVYGSIP